MTGENAHVDNSLFTLMIYWEYDDCLNWSLSRYLQEPAGWPGLIVLYKLLARLSVSEVCLS